eukprot:scaffold287_cov337-Pavlova_lutheri.AAC.228
MASTPITQDPWIFEASTRPFGEVASTTLPTMDCRCFAATRCTPWPSTMSVAGFEVQDVPVTTSFSLLVRVRPPCHHFIRRLRHGFPAVATTAEGMGRNIFVQSLLSNLPGSSRSIHPRLPFVGPWKPHGCPACVQGRHGLDRQDASDVGRRVAFLLSIHGTWYRRDAALGVFPPFLCPSPLGVVSFPCDLVKECGVGPLFLLS